MPVEDETANDRFDVVFVDERTAVEDTGINVIILVMTDYLGLVVQGDLGVRDNKSRQKSVRSATITTADAADTHTNGSGRCFEGTVVITVNSEACRVPTGTGQLVELQAGDEVIIFILDIFDVRIAIEGK